MMVHFQVLTNCFLHHLQNLRHLCHHHLNWELQIMMPSWVERVYTAVLVLCLLACFKSVSNVSMFCAQRFWRRTMLPSSPGGEQLRALPNTRQTHQLLFDTIPATRLFFFTHIIIPSDIVACFLHSLEYTQQLLQAWHIAVHCFACQHWQ